MDSILLGKKQYNIIKHTHHNKYGPNIARETPKN